MTVERGQLTKLPLGGTPSSGSMFEQGFDDFDDDHHRGFYPAARVKACGRGSGRQSWQCLPNDMVKEFVTRIHGAAVMNPWSPRIAVTAFGPIAVPEAPAFMEVLRAAFEAEPVWLDAAEDRRVR
ncbi:hypothetical protein DM292_09135 [Stutzerimonas frequens]|uniref:hypothetical protein n=1 Tax=Stutzerimonas frequens TaxID=2968969 RepID=UPI000D7D944A|nr:hypothetical protein [Stutzerimonas frequens]AWT10350.1 hypothetical protein DM292_09135 [Stutzerimonas frequens]